MPAPTAGAIELVGFPLKFSGTPSRIGAPPPLLGQHTEAVLGDLGYSAAGIVTVSNCEAYLNQVPKFGWPL